MGQGEAGELAPQHLGNPVSTFCGRKFSRQAFAEAPPSCFGGCFLEDPLQTRLVFFFFPKGKGHAHSGRFLSIRPPRQGCWSAEKQGGEGQRKRKKCSLKARGCVSFGRSLRLALLLPSPQQRVPAAKITGLSG